MTSQPPLGPYPVMTRDEAYNAVVGHNGAFWFRVSEGDHPIDGGGVKGDLVHLVQLLEASWIYCDWPAEQALIDVLSARDPALSSKMGEIAMLLKGNVTHT